MFPLRRQQPARSRFLPGVESLEDRAVPSAGRAVDHLRVSIVGSLQAGDTALVRVDAVDASNHRVANYRGTIHVTSTDSAAKVPADYTFRARDRGDHLFRVTFVTAGTQTLTATDTKSSTITGGDTVTITAPAPATQLVVFAAPLARSGGPYTFILMALDASGRQARGYTGKVHFSSGDSAAKLPADYQFSAADHGRHVFRMTWATKGSQTLTVSDNSATPLSTTSSVFVSAVGLFGLFPNFGMRLPF